MPKVTRLFSHRIIKNILLSSPCIQFRVMLSFFSRKSFSSCSPMMICLELNDGIPAIILSQIMTKKITLNGDWFLYFHGFWNSFKFLKILLIHSSKEFSTGFWTPTRLTWNITWIENHLKVINQLDYLRTYLTSKFHLSWLSQP